MEGVGKPRKARLGTASVLNTRERNSKARNEILSDDANKMLVIRFGTPVLMYLSPSPLQEKTRRPAIPAETHGSQSPLLITLLFVAVLPALHAARGPQILPKSTSNPKILGARRVTRSHKY